MEDQHRNAGERIERQGKTPEPKYVLLEDYAKLEEYGKSRREVEERDEEIDHGVEERG